MKNLLRFLTLTLLLSITACTTNDDGDTSVGLEGTWLMTSFDVGEAYDLNGDGTANSDVIVETGCYQNETLDFNVDGTGVSTNRSFVDIQVTIVTGTTDEVTYSVECIDELFTQAFTWGQTGSTVLITIDGFFITASLDGDTLTFTIPAGFSIDIPDGNGGLITLDQNVTMVYTKQ